MPNHRPPFLVIKYATTCAASKLRVWIWIAIHVAIVAGALAIQARHVSGYEDSSFPGGVGVVVFIALAGAVWPAHYLRALHYYRAENEILGAHIAETHNELPQEEEKD